MRNHSNVDNVKATIQVSYIFAQVYRQTKRQTKKTYRKIER